MRSWLPAFIVVLAVGLAAYLSAPQAAQQQPTAKPVSAPATAAPAAQTTAAKPAQTTAPKPAPAAPKPAPAAPKPVVQTFNGKPLPPVQYVCTMVGDEGVLEDKPGKCPNPKCGMDLRPVRLTEAYSSLSHPTLFIQLEPGGKDKIDGSALMPITASMFFTCPGSEEHLMDPGKCADGSARKMGLERRPHGDHNPRHGGLFFMAEDKWHHLEGTYPRGGPFRVFFYDDFTRPMPVKGFTATVAVVDKDDKEIATFPLKPGRETNTLEAPITGAGSPTEAAPVKLNLRVQFDPKEKSALFNFAFNKPTTE